MTVNLMRAVKGNKEQRALNEALRSKWDHRRKTDDETAKTRKQYAAAVKSRGFRNEIEYEEHMVHDWESI